MSPLSELTRKHIEGNTSSAQDQEAHYIRYNELLSRYNAATARIDGLITKRERRKS